MKKCSICETEYDEHNNFVKCAVCGGLICTEHCIYDNDLVYEDKDNFIHNDCKEKYFRGEINEKS
jgi:hypothetical protein